MNHKIKSIADQIIEEAKKREGSDLVSNVYTVHMQIQAQIIAFMEKQREDAPIKQDPWLCTTCGKYGWHVKGCPGERKKIGRKNGTA